MRADAEQRTRALLHHRQIAISRGRSDNVGVRLPGLALPDGGQLGEGAVERGVVREDHVDLTYARNLSGGIKAWKTRII